MKKIAVIGGGAAGMMAAAEAALCGAEVALYERNDRVGKKILMTGNGKCNLSNITMDASCFYSSEPHLLEPFLERYAVTNTRTFFEGEGLRLRVKHGGVYPYCEQASAVLDMLRLVLHRRGVSIHTEKKINAFKKDTRKGLFYLSEESCGYDAVILACGGKAAPKTGSDGSGYELAKAFGHTIVPVVPALVQLRCKGDYFKTLGGVRCEAAVGLYVQDKLVQTERGEVQFTEYGISGIPVFQLSRMAAYERAAGSPVKAVIDFFPEEEEGSFVERELFRHTINKELSLEESLLGLCNKKINLVMVKEASLKPSGMTSTVTKKAYCDLLASYKQFTVLVEAPNSFEQAQVSAGGVPLHELSKDLESRKEKGLFFAGELIDVDGRCGGYNLQWAWTSAAIAARGATKQIKQKREGLNDDTDKSAENETGTYTGSAVT